MKFLAKGIDMITGLKNKKQSYLLKLRDEERKEKPNIKFIKIFKNKINGLNIQLRNVKK